MPILVLIAVIWFVAGPFISIAALNGLGAHLDYTIITWLSALWFHVVFAAKAGRK